MPALRGILLALIAISLTGCGMSFGSTDPGWHGPAWQRGFHAGREARQHYFSTTSHGQRLIAYCAETAFADIQPMKSAVVPWAEGFNIGCTTRRHPHFARQRPSGTPAPR
jgi:hypothetical protein